MSQHVTEPQAGPPLLRVELMPGMFRLANGAGVPPGLGGRVGTDFHPVLPADLHLLAIHERPEVRQRPLHDRIPPDGFVAALPIQFQEFRLGA